MKVTVRVPATSANLGPGFDILAVALQLQNEVIAETRETDEVTLELTGQTVPTDPDQNAVVAGYTTACDSLGIAAGQRGLHLQCDNVIPPGRGLGSSAAARLSGVLVAVAVHRAAWDEQDILACVSAMEGHRDNAAAALHGGLVICADDRPVARVDVPDELSAVVHIPNLQLATEKARGLVPDSYSRPDAIFNAARVGLLVRAFALRDYGELGTAMEDRWHQPQRAAVIPWLPDVISAARGAGALGAALSGAGPSTIALALRHHEAIAGAMEAAASRHGIEGTTQTLRLRNFGARVDVKG